MKIKDTKIIPLRSSQEDTVQDSESESASGIHQEDLMMVNFQELIHEIKIFHDNEEFFRQIWWIPMEFWEILLNQNTQYFPDVTEEILEYLFPYFVVIAEEGIITSKMDIRYTSESKIRSSISLLDDQGKKYEPIPKKQIPVPVKDILNIAYEFLYL